jgi:SAM-dependent methyltransferase
MDQTTRGSADLADRLKAEASFHDHKYATGDSFPKHYKVQPTLPVFHRMLARLPEDLSKHHVLEYGCGTGWITSELAQRGAHVAAFDISPEAVAQTQATLHAKGLDAKCDIRVMPGEALAFPDSSFDYAIGFAILHHLELERALAELHRVLKPQGVAFFAEPLGSNPLINAYRRRTPQYRTEDEAPIDIDSLRQRLGRFRSFDHHDQLITATAAVALAYVPGLGGLAGPAQRALMRFDDVLLKVIPQAGRFAWYSILVLTK